MTTQQFHEQNMGDLPPQADASKLPSDPTSASAQQSELGPGTNVAGEPVNPLHESGHASATSHEAFHPASAETRAAPIPPTSESHVPDNVSHAPPSYAETFPTTHMPKTTETTSNQYAASQQPTAQGATPSAYVQTHSLPGATAKTPMDSIMQVFNKWSKKAEDYTGNVWGHLRTGPNVADTAMGRIAMGTRAMSEGGIENVYRQTFEVAPDEHLLKTYACYLSTSTGPVAGTLYISSHKLAFCSDRPLAIPSQPGVNNDAMGVNNDATNLPSPSGHKTSKKQASAQPQQQFCYYKVMVPITQVESVNPSENTQKKPTEKYVQVKTTDGHEFWFMGFVNYDKGVKNLQEALVSRNTGPTTTANTGPTTIDTTPMETGPTATDTTSSTPKNTGPTTTNTASYTDPTTNTGYHVA